MTFRIASHLAFATLVMAAIVPAVAVADTVADPTFLFLQPDAGFGQNVAFGATFATSGTDFIEDFLFNPPPPQADVSFSFLSAFADAQPEIKFTGFSLAPFQPGETPVPVPLDAVSGSFFGSGSTIAPIDAGVYVLEIRGTTQVDNAVFNGGLNATIYQEPAAAAVPEPETWGLMALGLGIVAAVSRPRHKQPA